MPTASRCPRCGAALAAGADLCPRCLLAAGASSGGGPSSDFDVPAVEELAAHFEELEIEELVARGGMGLVYRARQKRLDRPVALKVLPRELARDPAFAERFAREARALAQLDHPHIVRVHDYGQDDTYAWLVMEWVDGTDLRRVLEASDLEPRQALAIVPQVCDALQAAHERGIVHRDIKPENILLDQHGRVRIADFGIAKLTSRAPVDVTLTRSQQVMGTWHYMAPEQLAGSAAVDHRADIYSLGVVFYELLTGRVPVGNFAPPSKSLAVDARLDEIVLKALESEPERRYQTAVAVKTDVEHLDGAPEASAPAASSPTDGSDAERTTRAIARFFGDFGLAFVGLPCALPFLELGWPGVAIGGIVFGLFALGACKLRGRALADVRQERTRWSLARRFDREVGALMLFGLGFVALLAGFAIRVERGTEVYHPPHRDASLVANRYDDFEYRLVRELVPPVAGAEWPEAFLATTSAGYEASLHRADPLPALLLAALSFLAGALSFFAPRGGFGPWPRVFFPASAFWTGALVAFTLVFHGTFGLFGPVSTSSELRVQGTLPGSVDDVRAELADRLADAGYDVHSYWNATIREKGTDARLGELFSIVAQRPVLDRWALGPLGIERESPHFAIHGFGRLVDGGTRVVVEAGVVPDGDERRAQWEQLARALVTSSSE